MLDVQVKTEQLSETARMLMELPGLFARARVSALKSLGWAVQQELKNEGRKATHGGYLHWQELNPHTGVLARARDKSGRSQYVYWPKGNRHTGKIRWSKAGRSGGSIGSGGERNQVIRRLSSRREPFSRMVNMVRYSVDAEDNLVEIGFLNTNYRTYGLLRKGAEGFSTSITPRMRKFLFAMGFPVRKGTRLESPARPWVTKVEQVWRPKASGYFEQKFFDAISRYQEGGK